MDALFSACATVEEHGFSRASDAIEGSGFSRGKREIQGNLVYEMTSQLCSQEFHFFA